MSGKGHKYQSICRLLEEVKEKVLFGHKGNTGDVKSQADIKHDKTECRRNMLQQTKSIGGSNASSSRDLKSSSHGTQRDMGLPIGTHGRLMVQQSMYRLSGTLMKDLDGDNDDDNNSKGNASMDVVQYRLKTRNVSLQQDLLDVIFLAKWLLTFACRKRQGFGVGFYLQLVSPQVILAFTIVVRVRLRTAYRFVELHRTI